MGKVSTAIFILLIFSTNITFGADTKAPEVFDHVVKPDNSKKIKDYMGKHLYVLFDNMMTLMSKLETQANLTPEEFKALYQILTEMRAHFVAVIPKMPAKIKNLEPKVRAEKFRLYQKYLNIAINYTLKIEEAIDKKAATEDQIQVRKETLINLVGKFNLIVFNF